MRVLHIITNFEARGGAETTLLRIIVNMKQEEHHLVSLMTTSSLYAEALNQCKTSHSLLWRLKNTPSTVWQLVKLIRLINPDVIQCWMYHANILGIIAAKIAQTKSPVLWNIRHSLTDFKSESFSVKISIILGRIFSSWPTKVIYCSQKAISQHEIFGFKQGKAVYIPNGLDALWFRRKKVTTNKKEYIIGTAGRFHEAKGYPFLLDTLKLLLDQRDDIFFYLAGKGIDQSNIAFKSLLIDKEINLEKIKLLGDVHDMIDFYHKLDLFVLSSITEGFPNVLIEAMSTGTPCVTTDVGDACYIVNNSDFVVKPKDPVALASSITNFLNLSRDKKEMITQNGISMIEDRYKISNIVVKYRTTWERGRELIR